MVPPPKGLLQRLKHIFQAKLLTQCLAYGKHPLLSIYLSIYRGIILYMLL